jgi:methylenetetrahydrofolate dehydrogenase (NADP+)/methenyltetrahydrofolate cyclohydrolase
MKTLNGKEEKELILSQLKEKISQESIKPGLAILLIGDDKASHTYVALKEKAAIEVGINFNLFKFSNDSSEEEIIEKIEELNSDDSINGIIVQLPLVGKFNTEKIIQSIDPKKDVDGFHEVNLNLIKEGKKPFFYSPFMKAIVLSIDRGVGLDNLGDKKIVSLVNSDLFGETLNQFFKEREANHEYLKDIDLDKIKEADLLILTKGVCNIVDVDMVKEAVVIINGGVSYVDGKACGDLDIDRIEEKASFITPTIGGIGPLTIAYLLDNIYRASRI